MRVISIAVLLIAALAFPAQAGAAPRIRDCPSVVIAKNSGDFWAKVKVVGVTCRYADRFLRRSSLPRGWRYRTIARNLRSMCGGDRVRFRKSRSRITASRSLC